MTREQIIAAISERDAIALTIWREASGTTAGRMSIALVIATRARDAHRRYGDGFKGVCLKPAEFGCWWLSGGDENHRHLMAAAERIVTGDTEIWKQDEGLRECAEIAEALICASSATHYMTTALYRMLPPWAHGKTPSRTCAGHVFFLWD